MLFGRTDPAITSLVAKCFAQSSKYGSRHPIVERALSFVLGFQNEDGGIYVEDLGLRSYYTSVATMALSVMDASEWYRLALPWHRDCRVRRAAGHGGWLGVVAGACRQHRSQRLGDQTERTQRRGPNPGFLDRRADFTLAATQLVGSRNGGSQRLRGMDDQKTT